MAKAKKPSLAKFSDEELQTEMMKRTQNEIDKSVVGAEMKIIKSLRRECRRLEDGIKYPITIGGIEFTIWFRWIDEDFPTPYYNGQNKVPDRKVETLMMRDAIDELLDQDTWRIEELPQIKKPRQEVTTRIKKLMNESNRLAEKYEINRHQFFRAYIYEQ